MTTHLPNLTNYQVLSLFSPFPSLCPYSTALLLVRFIKETWWDHLIGVELTVRKKVGSSKTGPFIISWLILLLHQCSFMVHCHFMMKVHGRLLVLTYFDTNTSWKPLSEYGSPEVYFYLRQIPSVRLVQESVYKKKHICLIGDDRFCFLSPVTVTSEDNQRGHQHSCSTMRVIISVEPWQEWLMLAYALVTAGFPLRSSTHFSKDRLSNHQRAKFQMCVFNLCYSA